MKKYTTKMKSYAELRSIAKDYPWQPIADTARPTPKYTTASIQRSPRIGSERTAYGGELAYVLGLRCLKDAITKDEKPQFDPDGHFDLCEGCYCLIKAGHLAPKMKGKAHVCPVCSVLMNAKSYASTVDDEDTPSPGYFCDKKDPTLMFDTSGLEWKHFKTNEDHRLPALERMWIQDPRLKFRRLHHWVYHHFKLIENGGGNSSEAQLCFRCNKVFQTENIKLDALCTICRSNLLSAEDTNTSMEETRNVTTTSTSTSVTSTTTAENQQSSISTDDDQDTAAAILHATERSSIRSHHLPSHPTGTTMAEPHMFATETSRNVDQTSQTGGDTVSPTSAWTQDHIDSSDIAPRSRKHSEMDDETNLLMPAPKVSRKHSTQDNMTSKSTFSFSSAPARKVAQRLDQSQAAGDPDIHSTPRQSMQSFREQGDSMSHSKPRRTNRQAQGQAFDADANFEQGLLTHVTRMVEKLKRYLSQVSETDSDLGMEMIGLLRNIQPPEYQYIDITLYYMCIHLFSDGTTSAWTNLLQAGELENWLKRDVLSTSVVVMTLVLTSVFARMDENGVIENTVHVCCSQLKSMLEYPDSLQTVLQHNLELLKALIMRYGVATD